MTEPVAQPQVGRQSFSAPNTGVPAGYPAPNTGACAGYPTPHAGYPTPDGSVPAGHPAAGFPPPAPKPSAGKKALVILGVIAAIAVVAVIKFGIGGIIGDATDDTKKAAVGNCVAVEEKTKIKEGESGAAEAEVVDCGSAAAQFEVVGRVEGTTNVEGPACDTFFEKALKEGEQGSVYGNSANGGYLLCLKPKT